MAKRKTKAYSESYRKEAVRLADLPDRTAADVARALTGKPVFLFFPVFRQE